MILWEGRATAYNLSLRKILAQTIKNKYVKNAKVKSFRPFIKPPTLIKLREY